MREHFLCQTNSGRRTHRGITPSKKGRWHFITLALSLIPPSPRKEQEQTKLSLCSTKVQPEQAGSGTSWTPFGWGRRGGGIDCVVALMHCHFKAPNSPHSSGSAQMLAGDDKSMQRWENPVFGESFKAEAENIANVMKYFKVCQVEAVLLD